MLLLLRFICDFALAKTFAMILWYFSSPHAPAIKFMNDRRLSTKNFIPKIEKKSYQLIKFRLSPARQINSSLIENSEIFNFPNFSLPFRFSLEINLKKCKHFWRRNSITQNKQVILSIVHSLSGSHNNAKWELQIDKKKVRNERHRA